LLMLFPFGFCCWGAHFISVVRSLVTLFLLLIKKKKEKEN